MTEQQTQTDEQLAETAEVERAAFEQAMASMSSGPDVEKPADEPVAAAQSDAPAPALDTPVPAADEPVASLTVPEAPSETDPDAPPADEEFPGPVASRPAPAGPADHRRILDHNAKLAELSLKA